MAKKKKSYEDIKMGWMSSTQSDDNYSEESNAPSYSSIRKKWMEENQYEDNQMYGIVNKERRARSLYKGYADAEASAPSAVQTNPLSQGLQIPGASAYSNNYRNNVAQSIGNQMKSANPLGKGVAGYRDMISNQNAEKLRNMDAEKAYHLSILPELEKKKYGNANRSEIADAESRLHDLSDETYYDLMDSVKAMDGISFKRPEKISKKIQEREGWDEDTVTSYIDDAYKVYQFNKDNKNANTLDTDDSNGDSETILYSKAKIDSLENDERDAVNQILKGMEQKEYYKNHYFNEADPLNNNPIRAIMYSSQDGSSDIEAGKERLKALGWNNRQIEEYADYASYIASQYGTEEYNKNFEIDENASTGKKIASGVVNTIYDLAENPTRGIAGALESFNEHPSGLGRDVNSSWIRPQTSSQYATEEVTNSIDNPIGKKAYQYGLSTLESAELVAGGAALGSVGKYATLVPFATQAYTSGYQEAKERGASNEQANLYGIASGAAEAGTELISLDHLWDMAKGKKISPKWVVDWLMQGGIEASEEAATDLLNRYSDYLILGKDGKNAMTKSIDKFAEEIRKNNRNLTDDEVYAMAKHQAHVEFWNQVGDDALGGFVSGLALGFGASALGTARRNEGLKSNSELYQQNADKITGETEYDKTNKAEAEKYAKNPVRAIADNIDDSTQAGMESKEKVLAVAENYDKKGKLSIQDNYELNNALEEADKANNTEEAIDSRIKYLQYVAEASQAPAEYRTASTGITEAEARAQMQEAAKNGDVMGMASVYNAMKASKSAATREAADQTFNDFVGMAENAGATQEDLNAAKTSRQEAYISGMRGEEVGNITPQAQEAYNAGAQERIKKQTLNTVGNTSELSMVRTSDGRSVSVKGFNGNQIETTDGKMISVKDLDENSFVSTVYRTAATLPESMRETFMNNLREGDNISDLAYTVKSAIREAISGNEYEDYIKTLDGQKALGEFGDDRLSEMYIIGLDMAKDDVSNNRVSGIFHMGNRVTKGNGSFDAHSREIARKYGASSGDIDAVYVLAKAFGLNFKVVESSLDGENANIQLSNSTITVNANAFRQVAHELVGEFMQEYNREDHDALRKDLMGATLALFGQEKFNSNYDSYVKAYKNIHLSDIDIQREMTNDIFVEVLSTDKGMQAFADYVAEKYGVEVAKTTKEKLIDFVDHFKEAFKNIMSTGTETKSNLQKNWASKADELDKYTERVIKAFDKAVQNYQAMEEAEVNEVTEKVGVQFDAATESASPSDQYSLMTWEASEYVQHRKDAIDELSKALKITKKQATKYIDDINSIARMIADDRVRLDYDADPNGSSFVSNAEYGGSIDFSTICKKRLLYTGTLQAIQKQIGNRVITMQDYLDIRNAMLEDGLQTTCGCCYVEGSRAKLGQFMKEFIKRYAEDNPPYIPTMYDVTMPDGIRQLRAKHPEAWQAREYFLNHMGQIEGHVGEKNLFGSQGKPKDYSERTEYRGEILTKFLNKEDTVREKNLNGGLRLQSFSDFEIVNLIDCMQVITDMSRCGLAGQAYTKVKEFADALGNTGLKINLSLMGKGVDANGNLILDEINGMKKDDAIYLRNKYSKNVGTIIVCFTDEQIKAAMASDYIDFIIPFHRSQWRKSQYDALGLPEGTRDYTMHQNDRMIKGNGKLKKADRNYMPNEYWDYSKDGRYNAEKYIDMCNKDGKSPKFAFLLSKDSKGKYYLPEGKEYDGYFKLLIDFKMYDNDGVGAPQMPVVPNFSMDECRQMLNEYTGGHETFPVDEKIANQFAEKIKAREKEFSYGSNDVKYSIEIDATGKKYVDIQEDLISNITDDSQIKDYVWTYMEEAFESIDMFGFNLPVTSVGRDEFIRSKYTDMIRKHYHDIFIDKMRMANNLDEIVDAADNYKHEDPKHPRKDDIIGFVRGKVNVRVGSNDYVADVVLADRKNAGIMFYDIVTINPTTIKAVTKPILQNNGVGRKVTAFKQNITQSSAKSNIKNSLKVDSEGFYQFENDALNEYEKTKVFFKQEASKGDPYIYIRNAKYVQNDTWKALADIMYEDVNKWAYLKKEATKETSSRGYGIDQYFTSDILSYLSGNNVAKDNYLDREIHAEEAEKYFKTTSDFDKAGYLDINGKLLDFSEGQNYRAQDHREISQILDLPDDAGYSDGLIQFMSEGNIRMQSYGIDIAVAPNDAQISVLKKFFSSLNGEVSVDFSKENGDTAGSTEYRKGTSPTRIINDINDYFATGKIPTGNLDSVLAFRYSLTVDSDGSQLSEGQKRYFKDSKAVDADGHLKVYYHGSHTPGFTVFDPNMSDDKISLFFTDNLDNAASYSGTRELFEPDRHYSFDELNDIITSFTMGDWEVKQIGNEYAIIMSEEYEETRGSLDDLRDYFIENYLYYLFEENGANYKVYLNATNPLVIDAKGAEWNKLPSINGSKEKVTISWNGTDDFANYTVTDSSGKQFAISEMELFKEFGEGVATEVQNADYGTKVTAYINTVTTRDYAAYAKENGYDSVIIRNLIDYDINLNVEEKPSEVVIVFNSNQVKSTENLNPTQDADIRYSMEIDDMMEFMDEFVFGDKYNSFSSILDDGLKALKGKQVDSKLIRSVATKLHSEYGSTMKIDTLANMLEKTFAYLQTQDHVNYNDVMRVVEEIAKPFIEAIPHKEGQAAYDAFVSGLKGYKIKLSSAQMTEVKKAYGSYKAYQQAMFPLRISNNAEMDMDELWSSLVEASGYILDPETNEGNQPMAILDALDSLRPTVENNFNATDEEMARDLAMRIVEEYFGAQESEALKDAAARAKAVSAEYRDKIKADYQKRLAEAKKQIREDTAHAIENAKYGARWAEAEAKEKAENKIAKIRDEADKKVKEAKANARLSEAEKNKQIDQIKAEADQKVREARYNIKWNEAENNLKLAEMRAKNKKKLQNSKEVAEQRRQKGMISKQAKKLMKWVMEPTDQYHVPKEFAEPLMEFLYALDFVEPELNYKNGKYSVKVYSHSVVDEYGHRRMVFDTLEGNTREEVLQKFYDAIGSGMGSRNQKQWTERMRSLQDMLNKVSNDDHTDWAMDNLMMMLDPELADEFNDLLMNNRGVANINTLSSADLKTINKVIRGITHAINMGNKAITQNATIDEWANDTIENAKDVKLKSHTKTFNKLSKTLSIDMATPETFFALQGKKGSQIFNSFMVALERKITDIKKASEYMSDALKDIDKKKLKKWTGNHAEVYSFNVHDGRIDLTIAQIMSLYELNKREQAVYHFVGGVKADTIIIKGREQIQNRAVHLTQQDLIDIFSVLTDEQKELADKMQQFLATECAKWGNEAAMLMYGYEKYTDPRYFPISTSKDTIAANNENTNREAMNGLEKSGFTKAVVKNANNPILIRDIFDVFTDHVTDMAAYHGYAPAIKDANRWFNFKTAEDIGNGFKEYTTVQQAINNNMFRADKSGTDYFVNLIHNINGFEKSGDIETIIDALVSTYKTAAIAGNLRVVIQQPTAFVRAANILDWKYMVSSLPKTFTASKNMERIKEISPLAWWKSQGYYEASLGKSIKEIVTGSATVRDKITEKSMWLAGKADDITWSILYSATEKQVKAETKGQNISEEEFRKMVNDKFNDVIAQTQVVDATIMKSQWMRSNAKYTKLKTAFMSEPTKSYNMAMKAALKDYREEGGNPLKWKATRKALVVLALTDLLNSIAQAIIDGVRYKDDDDSYWETVMDYFEKNMLQAINPLNRVPGLKDITDPLFAALKGESSYGSSFGRTLEASAIESLLDTLSTSVKIVNGSYNKTPFAAYMTYAKALSYATGVPLYNISRDGAAFWNLFASGEHQLVKNVETANAKYKSFFDALDKEKSDEKLYEALDKAMGKNGTIKDVKSQIASKYKADYLLSVTTADKESQDALYTLMKRAYNAINLTEDDLNADIAEWMDTSVSYTDLDKAIESGEGIADAVAKLKDAGKEDDAILEHLYNTFGSTIEFNSGRKNGSEIEAGVNEALKAVGKTETKSMIKEAIYRSISEATTDYQKEIDKIVTDADSLGTFKKAITEKYKAQYIEMRDKDPASANILRGRLADVRAYADKVAGFKGNKGKKYRDFELGVIDNWVSE